MPRRRGHRSSELRAVSNPRNQPRKAVREEFNYPGGAQLRSNRDLRGRSLSDINRLGKQTVAQRRDVIARFNAAKFQAIQEAESRALKPLQTGKVILDVDKEQALATEMYGRGTILRPRSNYGNSNKNQFSLRGNMNPLEPMRDRYHRSGGEPLLGQETGGYLLDPRSVMESDIMQDRLFPGRFKQDIHVLRKYAEEMAGARNEEQALRAPDPAVQRDNPLLADAAPVAAASRDPGADRRAIRTQGSSRAPVSFERSQVDAAVQQQLAEDFTDDLPDDVPPAVFPGQEGAQISDNFTDRMRLDQDEAVERRVERSGTAWFRGFSADEGRSLLAAEAGAKKSVFVPDELRDDLRTLNGRLADLAASQNAHASRLAETHSVILNAIREPQFDGALRGLISDLLAVSQASKLQLGALNENLVRSSQLQLQNKATSGDSELAARELRIESERAAIDLRQRMDQVERRNAELERALEQQMAQGQLLLEDRQTVEQRLQSAEAQAEMLREAYDVQAVRNGETDERVQNLLLQISARDNYAQQLQGELAGINARLNEAAARAENLETSLVVADNAKALALEALAATQQQLASTTAARAQQQLSHNPLSVGFQTVEDPQAFSAAFQHSSGGARSEGIRDSMAIVPVAGPSSSSSSRPIMRGPEEDEQDAYLQVDAENPVPRPRASSVRSGSGRSNLAGINVSVAGGAQAEAGVGPSNNEGRRARGKRNRSDVLGENEQQEAKRVRGGFTAETPVAIPKPPRASDNLDALIAEFRQVRRSVRGSKRNLKALDRADTLLINYGNKRGASSDSDRQELAHALNFVIQKAKK